MTHIKIEQNSIPEDITISTLNKLYSTVYGSTLDLTSNLAGYLRIPYAYRDTINYLTTMFPDLHIEVTGGYYVQFSDAETHNVLATNFGDGTNITEAQVNSITNLGQVFVDNDDVIIADLSKLNNLTGLYYSNQVYHTTPRDFQGCSNLKRIILPPSCKYMGCDIENYHVEYFTPEYIEKLEGTPFLTGGINGEDNVLFSGMAVNFKNLKTWNEYTPYTKTSFFSRCRFKQIYLPKITTTYSGTWFDSWASADGFLARGGGSNHFYCRIIYFKDLAKVYTAAFCCIVDCAGIVINNTTPPTCANTGDQTTPSNSGEDVTQHMFDDSSIGGQGQAHIYVPDSAISAYQNHAVWGTLATVHGISELNNGIIYSTVSDWEFAGKPDGLIAEYLDLSDADLAQFIIDNSLTVYARP